MFNETINGVDVFEVGKEQLWGWCHHMQRYVGLHATIINNAETLRKGVYVVVEHRAIFGRFERVSYIYDSFTSKVAAIGYVLDLMDLDLFHVEYEWTRILSDYEVWHVCDDGDLWQAWDAMSEVAAASGEPVHDMSDVFAYQLMQQVSNLEERAQEEGAYGCQVNGSYDMCDLLNIYCDDYDSMTEDARDALDELYDKLTVIDYNTCNVRWNALIDEDMTNRLIDHYAPRIWDYAGNVRTASSDE